MSTLVEIEAAVDALPSEQKRELLLFVAARLRAEGCLPEPRMFSAEQVNAWISEDEADMRRFNGEPNGQK
jgi:hypothetical protein